MNLRQPLHDAQVLAYRAGDARPVGVRGAVPPSSQRPHRPASRWGHRPASRWGHRPASRWGHRPRPDAVAPAGARRFSRRGARCAPERLPHTDEPGPGPRRRVLGGVARPPTLLELLACVGRQFGEQAEPLEGGRVAQHAVELHDVAGEIIERFQWRARFPPEHGSSAATGLNVTLVRRQQGHDAPRQVPLTPEPRQGTAQGCGHRAHREASPSDAVTVLAACARSIRAIAAARGSACWLTTLLPSASKSASARSAAADPAGGRATRRGGSPGCCSRPRPAGHA